LIGLMPGLKYRSIHFDSCATSFSPNGNPFIYPQTDHIIALTAGNGAAAKCADEIGRLGAIVATGGAIPDYYDGAFAP
jgi:sarcosine oxidase